MPNRDVSHRPSEGINEYDSDYDSSPSDPDYHSDTDYDSEDYDSDSDYEYFMAHYSDMDHHWWSTQGCPRRV